MKTHRMLMVAASVLLMGNALRAQFISATAIKEPRIATLWGVLVPGAGQMYAGRSGKGLLLFVGAVGAASAGAIIHSNPCLTPLNYVETRCDNRTTPLAVGTTIAAGLWIYGFVTADDDAHARNARASGAPQLSVQPLVSRRGLGLHATVSIAF